MRYVPLINASEITPGIPPVGLEYLGEFLRSKDYSVRVIDLAQEGHGDLEQKIADPLAVGISIRNIDYTVLQTPARFLDDARVLVSKIRQMTRSPIILGGAGFSINPKEILSFVGGDFGVSGCAIPVAESLMKAIGEGSIERGTILQQSPNAEYLDFPFKRDLIDLKAYQDQGAWTGVNTKLGCGMQCIYCNYPVISGHRVILRSPAAVLGEIDNLQKRGINQIFFADSAFNIPSQHAIDICFGLKDSGVKWRAYFNPSPAFFSRDLVDSALEAHVDMVNLGIDSGSDAMLGVLKKGFTTKDIRRASEMCSERNIRHAFSVLFGAPGESKETIDETFDLIDQLEPEKVYVQSGIRIYGACELADRAVSDGFVRGNDLLFNHTFYPFGLSDYVELKTKERKNCHLPYK